jgi:SAM-dependent methyltransferase
MQMHEGNGFDEQRANHFADRVRTILNGGALALMISIGHRTGLFDVLRRLQATDSATIAARAGLDERYVREWLSAMVSGGLVEYAPETRAFRLPPEHAAVLARDARPNNLALVAQWIPLLGAVEDAIVTCFTEGGGIPRVTYERIAAVLTEIGDQIVVARLLFEILPRAPGLREALETGLDVLEVACGDGRALGLLARTFPRSRFTGWDVSEEAIASARQSAGHARLSNARFAVRDAIEVEPTPAYHLVTAFDAIHDHPRPGGVISAIARALRPGGLLLLGEYAGTSRLERDVAHPLAPLLYTLSCLHSIPVSLGADGPGLGSMAGEGVVRRLLEDAGLVDIEVLALGPSDCHLFYLARKAA